LPDGDSLNEYAKFQEKEEWENKNERKERKGKNIRLKNR